MSFKILVVSVVGSASPYSEKPVQRKEAQEGRWGDTLGGVGGHSFSFVCLELWPCCWAENPQKAPLCPALSSPTTPSLQPHLAAILGFPPKPLAQKLCGASPVSLCFPKYQLDLCKLRPPLLTLVHFPSKSPQCLHVGASLAPAH